MTLEQEIEKNGYAITKTEGDSMLPMIKNGTMVLIKKPKFPLEKYDIPVYKRDDHLTMHRIVAVKSGRYIICGDNRSGLERDITEDKIIGVLAGYFLDGKLIEAGSEQFEKFGIMAVKNLPKRIISRYIKRIFRGRC